MRKGIHPNYHEIEVVMTDGTTFKTRSTIKRERLVLDVDPKSHPAYTGRERALASRGQMERFRKRFGGMDIDQMAKKDKDARKGQ